MPILALVNNGLKYCINQLRLNLRYKLSVMLYNKYTDGILIQTNQWLICKIYFI